MFGFGKKKSAAPAPARAAAAPEPVPSPPRAAGARGPTPDEALQQLRDGNAAFLRGENNLGHVKANDLDELQAGQNPIATIVGCADSRTPPTILFNQGFGRLFSIRVAGNTVDRRGLASIIYAVTHLNCPLVVVMGHTGCGAVAAAESIVDGAALDPSLEEMIVPIIPPVLAARAGNGSPVEENARWVARKLATADASLADAVEAGTLKIVAAVKQMHSGEVKFLDV
ncbi:MAG: carbonic anhydrase [Alphaproteobacteria bacterium]|nr:carbonic anhydrase [Alphaproteobacteria bacterium]MBU1525738.1 carbonic anhydrase [Alphaproteobacteria bacterium]MBU2118405.1 carbonic anhydrase [Alphaproteobacteria bacterium]MBU2351881.1 carbonic anhydrase [Alphaproteobacteria bacterium]MBU2382735.1 carbonic anhydrase [Alphaproteobacteria bacterium]